MKNLKNGLTLLKFNLSSIVLFEIMYKLVSIAVLAPIMYGILNLSIEVAGIKYLYADTVGLYFGKPTTYVYFFVIILVLAMTVLINISGIIYALDASRRQEKTNPVTLMLKSIFNALRVARPRNMGIIVYVLLLLPITFSVVISGSLFGVQLPDFFERFFTYNKKIIVAVVVVYFLLCIIAVMRIFALNYFTSYGLNFGKSVYLSKKLMKRHAIKIYVGVVFCNVAILGVIFGIESAFALAVKGVLSQFISYRTLKFVIDIVLQITTFIVYITFSVISTPLIYSYICACFYDFEDTSENEEIIKNREENKKEKQKDIQIKQKNSIAYGALLVGAIVLNGIYIYLSVENKVNLNIYYSNYAQVTAHRGDSGHAPENTMAAITMAVENQADIVEIDVRQTKDGIFVIVHDESLERTTGINRNVGDVTYEYICRLDAGGYYSEEFVGEKIPTLEDALAYGKENRVFYNIELKPETYYANYVEGVVALIEEYEYEDDCLIASSDYNALKEVKKISPDIKTVYIMTMVIGHVDDMEYADGFSVRHNYINKELVRSIHKNGKEIYAWTLNDEKKIKELLLLDVDGIITDNPYETKEIIYSANDTLITDWLERLVEDY